MKIIISENQFDGIKNKLKKKIEVGGLPKTAKRMGMETSEFIDLFGFELDDDEIKGMVDNYMSWLLGGDVTINKSEYETPIRFLNTVFESVNEFCHNNLPKLNNHDEDVETETIYSKIEHYVIKKYGDKIIDKFNSGIDYNPI